MADRVIIVGASRRGEQIPIGELSQMGGRAGRGYESGRCRVDIIVEESDAEYVENGLGLKAELKVASVLGDRDLLAFHLVSEISRGEVVDLASAEQWHQRSFHAFSGGKVNWDKLFKNLQSLGAIQYVGYRVEATPIGEIASSFYSHPADVKAWQDNFSMVFKLGLENDDVAVAWALGGVDFYRHSGDFGKHREVLEEYQNQLPAGLELRDGCLMVSVLWWNVLGGPSVGKMRSQAIELKNDFGRIHRVLTALDGKLAKWNQTKFFDELLARSRRAIPANLAELFKVPGMTKGKAMALNEMGITTPQELQRALLTSDLEEILGDNP
jgi:hypothetical protein